MTTNPTPSQRILAVDPGEKRVGIALSDPTATIASPHSILDFHSRKQLAEDILALVREWNVAEIIIGLALDWDGTVSAQARKAERLADVLREKTSVPVQLWNEYGSTHQAQSAVKKMGLSQKKRREHVDHLAAAVILQNYLEYKLNREEE